MKPRHRRIASIGYLAAVGVGVFLALRNQRQQIVETLGDVAAADLALAAGLSVIALVLSMLGWRELLAGFGHRVSISGGSQVFFLSQVGKYLPGSVWPAVAQLEFGKAHDIPRRANAWSFFGAMLISLLTGLVVGALALISTGTVLLPLVALVLVGAAAIIVQRFDHRIVERFPRLERLRPQMWPDRRSIRRSASLFAAHWVLHGAHFALVMRALDLDTTNLLLHSIASFSLAFVAGTLFIIAPAGLGVREGVIVGLLGPLGIGVAAATAASLVSRLALTIADVVVACAAAAVTFRERGSPSTQRPS